VTVAVVSEEPTAVGTAVGTVAATVAAVGDQRRRGRWRRRWQLATVAAVEAAVEATEMATVEVMVEATVAATVAATVTTMAVARPGQGTRRRRRARGAGWDKRTNRNRVLGWGDDYTVQVAHGGVDDHEAVSVGGASHTHAAGSGLLGLERPSRPRVSQEADDVH
jgi:hypothetical protein